MNGRQGWRTVLLDDAPPANHDLLAGHEPGFEVSTPFLFFDYFRIPSRLTPAPAMTELPERHPLRSCGQFRWRGPDGRSSATVRWIPDDNRPANARYGEFRIDGITVFGHVASDNLVGHWLGELPGTWRALAPVRDAVGQRASSIWGDGRGNIFLPFDPGEFIANFWSEEYRAVGSSTVRTHAYASLIRAYYLIRPAVPRPVQLVTRSLFSRFQGARAFPHWPLETALHDLYDWLFRLVTEVAGAPVPWLSSWPDGHRWALVLTHDVETASGYEGMAPVLAAEIELGYRSSWNFVPQRYQVDDGLVSRLVSSGFEVGVHGLRHDGRDLASARLLAKRLPAIRAYADRWNAVGFRSPSTQRRWDLMPRLGFDYDTSYPDTDPFEPQPGGCCSWLPFFNKSTVELPITLPQDHTLFIILGEQRKGDWRDKAERMRDGNGMALALTHPDYLADPLIFDTYIEMLASFKDDETAWRALPRDVSAWWRQRRASVVRFSNGGWRVVGPASERGQVSFAPPPARETRTAAGFLSERRQTEEQVT
jgi:hypothetical protein